MRYSSILIFLLSTILSFGQNTKGLKVLQDTEEREGNTRALVIGISDYLHIEDLQYAHKDASIFYDYLRSNLKGFNDNNARLLLNEEANIGNIISAFEWLKAESKEGDRVIVYFSGHGDVETLTDAQNGFLLTHNSPKNVYWAGALPIIAVKDFFSTLTAQNIRVDFYVDACRSGQLSGGAKGAAHTSLALQQQWVNETKVLSCQPGEYSLESQEWGGGRGIFSYVLVEGLYGHADRNSDGEVRLIELFTYLQEKVPSMVEPLSQIPMVNGNFQTVMAHVSDNFIDSDEITTSDGNELLHSINLKGVMPKLVNELKDDDKNKYEEFKQLMANQIFWKPEKEESAFEVFKSLDPTNFPEELYQLMKGDLAAGLQNQAQEVINHYLSGKLDIITRASTSQYQKNLFAQAAKKMQISRSLLSEDHPMSDLMEARELFLEARSMARSYKTTDIERSIQKLKKSLEIEDEAAYALNALGLFYTLKEEYKTAIEYYKKASDLAPKWPLPINNIGIALSENDRPEEALDYFESALALDSNYIFAYGNFALAYAQMDSNELAEQFLKEAISKDSNYALAYTNLAILETKKGNFAEAENLFNKSLQIEDQLPVTFYNLGLLYDKTEKYDLSIESYTEAIKLYPDYYSALLNLGNVYLNYENPESASEQFKRCLELKKDDPRVLYNLGNSYFDLGQYEKSITEYKKVIELYPNYINGYYNIACAFGLLRNKEETYNYLGQAIERGYKNKSNIESSEEFEFIREESRFKNLLKESFKE